MLGVDTGGGTGGPGRGLDEQSDRRLLDEILKITPREAADALHRSRQALYAAFAPDSRIARLYFKPKELAALFLLASRKHARGVDRRAFFEFVDRTRGLVIADEVRTLLKPALGPYESLAIVLPDYERLSENALAKEAVIDLVTESADAAVTIFVPSKTEAKLFLGHLPGPIADFRVRYGTPVAAIPPLAIVTHSGVSTVFGISRGRFKRSDHFGGAQLLQCLDDWTDPVSLEDLRPRQPS